MVVLSGTCFDFIRHAAEYLQTQLLWDQADAIAFLMTGRCPSLAPLTVTYDVAHSPDGNPLRAEVVIRLQPFVSSDSVAAALTRVRLDIGRRLRPGPSMAERTLAIFDFVEQARASAGWTRPPWSELVIAWDADPARDGWQYEGDRRNFRRDYERARQLLLEDYLPARQRLDVQQPTAEAKSKAPRRKRA